MNADGGGAFWRVPRLWPGADVYVLAGGPSLGLLTPAALNALRERRVLAVNNAYSLGPWEAMLYGDCRWLDFPVEEGSPLRHRDALRAFAGLKITVCSTHGAEPGIRVVKRLRAGTGICFDAGALAWNLSTGACALNLAFHFGARRIILLGYDMRRVDGRHNWHRDNPGLTPRLDPYPAYRRRFRYIAESLRSRSVEVLNATPGSALTDFPIVAPESLGLPTLAAVPEEVYA